MRLGPLRIMTRVFVVLGPIVQTKSARREPIEESDVAEHVDETPLAAIPIGGDFDFLGVGKPPIGMLSSGIAHQHNPLPGSSFAESLYEPLHLHMLRRASRYTNVSVHHRLFFITDCMSERRKSSGKE